jgi:hypothetical protein
MLNFLDELKEYLVDESSRSTVDSVPSPTAKGAPYLLNLNLSELRTPVPDPLTVPRGGLSLDECLVLPDLRGISGACSPARRDFEHIGHTALNKDAEHSPKVLQERFLPPVASSSSKGAVVLHHTTLAASIFQRVPTISAPKFAHKTPLQLRREMALDGPHEGRHGSSSLAWSSKDRADSMALELSASLLTPARACIATEVSVQGHKASDSPTLHRERTRQILMHVELAATALRAVPSYLASAEAMFTQQKVHDVLMAQNECLEKEAAALREMCSAATAQLLAAIAADLPHRRALGVVDTSANEVFSRNRFEAFKAKARVQHNDEVICIKKETLRYRRMAWEDSLLSHGLERQLITLREKLHLQESANLRRGETVDATMKLLRQCHTLEEKLRFVVRHYQAARKREQRMAEAIEVRGTTSSIKRKSRQ